MPRASSPPSEGVMTDTWGRRNRTLPLYTCPRCKETFRPLRASSRYCSRPCAWTGNGKHNKTKPETWWLSPKGYVNGRIWVGSAKKAVKQHRLVMERHLDRALLPDEDVHHVNGNRADNRIENLQVIKHGEHATLTNRARWGARAALAKAGVQS